MPAAGQHKTWNVQVVRCLVSFVTFMIALGLGNTIQAARNVYPHCRNSIVQCFYASYVRTRGLLCLFHSESRGSRAYELYKL